MLCSIHAFTTNSSLKFPARHTIKEMKQSCSLHLASFKMYERAYNYDLPHKMQLQFILSSGTFKQNGFLSMSLTIGYTDCAIDAETSVLCKRKAKTHMRTAQRFYCHSVSIHVPRLGGGFGGKQVTSIFPASAAALAATCTGRSVAHFTCSPVSVGGWRVRGLNRWPPYLSWWCYCPCCHLYSPWGGGGVISTLCGRIESCLMVACQCLWAGLYRCSFLWLSF